MIGARPLHGVSFLLLSVAALAAVALVPAPARAEWSPVPGQVLTETRSFYNRTTRMFEVDVQIDQPSPLVAGVPYRLVVSNIAGGRQVYQPDGFTASGDAFLNVTGSVVSFELHLGRGAAVYTATLEHDPPPVAGGYPEGVCTVGANGLHDPALTLPTLGDCAAEQLADPSNWYAWALPIAEFEGLLVWLPAGTDPAGECVLFDGVSFAVDPLAGDLAGCLDAALVAPSSDYYWLTGAVEMAEALQLIADNLEYLGGLASALVFAVSLKGGGVSL